MDPNEVVTVDETSNGLKDIAFGSVAGMTSKLFEHPFDLVKVRLQSQPTDRPVRFTGPLDCFKQTWSREGWKGLYRGVSAPLVGAACENASLFLIYNKVQDVIRSIHKESDINTPVELGGMNLNTNSNMNLGTDTGDRIMSEKQKGKRRELSLMELALAAGIAGAGASFVLTPIELVKCRMQVQKMATEGILPKPTTSTTSTLSSFPKPPIISISATTPTTTQLQGPFQIIRSTIAQNGFRGLWLGQIGTLFRETGGSAAWFTAYEVVSRGFITYHEKQRSLRMDTGGNREPLTKKDLKTWELMAAGACAGMSYNVVLFPFDTIKSAMQTSSLLRSPPSTSASPSSTSTSTATSSLSPSSSTSTSTTAHQPKNSPSPSFFGIGKEIWKVRGMKGLYAGCGMTVMRAAPSSAMIFLIYESLEARFG